MRPLRSWLDEYSLSHTHRGNQLIHKVCVPLIMFSLLGILWALSAPYSPLPFVNLSTIFTAICLVFYFLIDRRLFAGMFICSATLIFALFQLSKVTELLPISCALFFVTWVLQFVGHKMEGVRPSFFKDLLFLLIGPLWVMNSFYQVLGIGTDTKNEKV